MAKPISPPKPLRRQSETRLKKPREERDTLTVCEVCKGNGSIFKEFMDGTYKMTECNWCCGEGYWPKHMAHGYERWKRISRRCKIR